MLWNPCKRFASTIPTTPLSGRATSKSDIFIQETLLPNETQDVRLFVAHPIIRSRHTEVFFFDRCASHVQKINLIEATILIPHGDGVVKKDTGKALSETSLHCNFSIASDEEMRLFEITGRQTRFGQVGKSIICKQGLKCTNPPGLEFFSYVCQWTICTLLYMLPYKLISGLSQIPDQTTGAPSPHLTSFPEWVASLLDKRFCAFGTYAGLYAPS